MSEAKARGSDWRGKFPGFPLKPPLTWPEFSQTEESFLQSCRASTQGTKMWKCVSKHVLHIRTGHPFLQRWLCKLPEQLACANCTAPVHLYIPGETEGRDTGQLPPRLQTHSFNRQVSILAAQRGEGPGKGNGSCGFSGVHSHLWERRNPNTSHVYKDKDTQVTDYTHI